MTSTTFVAHDSSTPIRAAWLNDADAIVYDIFNAATTVAFARTALGLGTAQSPTFAGVTATTFTGNLVGNVTGGVTGNVVGNLTGNVTGNISGTTGTFSSLTTGRVALVSTGGLLIDTAGLTFNTGTSTLTTNTFVGALTGNASTATLASTVTVADAASDTTTFVMLAGSATGSLPVLTDAGLSYDANSNILIAGGLSGPHNGTVGATTPAAGIFTTLSSTGNTTIGDAAADSLTVNAGIWSMPNIPCFAAYKSAQTNDQTGNGGSYTMIADTEIFDQGNIHNNSTGVVTAPTTGRYDFGGSFYITGCTIATTFVIVLATSNRNWQAVRFFRAAAAQDAQINFSFLDVDMDAGDTCTVIITVSGEAGNTDDIFGTSSPFTFFCGRQVA